jgi:hypothetical protein
MGNRCPDFDEQTLEQNTLSIGAGTNQSPGIIRSGIFLYDFAF